MSSLTRFLKKVRNTDPAGQLFTRFGDKAKEEEDKLNQLAQTRADALDPSKSSINFDTPLYSGATPGVGIDRVGELQVGITGRLNALRGNRTSLLRANADPLLEQTAEQAAQQRRGIGLMGSLGNQRRSAINNSALLQNQAIEQQALGNQLGQEHRLEASQTEFAGIFSSMASTDFSEELSGLGEEIDKYMAKKGREGKYADLATEAKEIANDMWSRVFDQAANEISDRRGDTTTEQRRIQSDRDYYNNQYDNRTNTQYNYNNDYYADNSEFDSGD